jgi:hypothetical protein
MMRHLTKIDVKKLSRTQKTTRIGTKPRTQQRKQITKNVSLNLIQDWKQKNIRQEHGICQKMIQIKLYFNNV